MLQATFHAYVLIIITWHFIKQVLHVSCKILKQEFIVRCFDCMLLLCGNFLRFPGALVDRKYNFRLRLICNTAVGFGKFAPFLRAYYDFNCIDPRHPTWFFVYTCIVNIYKYF